MNETLFQLYMENHDLCEQQAQFYAEAGDANLAQFYFSAAIGFKLKAKKLSIKEASFCSR